MRTPHVSAPGAQRARDPSNHMSQKKLFPRAQVGLPVPEVGDLVTSLWAEQIALVAELPAPVLVLDTCIHLIIRLLWRPRQLLIHALILCVDEVVLFRVTIRGPFRGRDVDHPRGRAHAIPGGARPRRGPAWTQHGRGGSFWLLRCKIRAGGRV